jgi:hypothetical protein
MGAAWERQGRGMACVNQTQPHCVNQVGKTLTITLATRHGRGMGTAGSGMACVKQTRPHCVNQMVKTLFIPLATRHCGGTAWARHGLCELVLKDLHRPRRSRPSLRTGKSGIVGHYITE